MLQGDHVHARHSPAELSVKGGEGMDAEYGKGRVVSEWVEELLKILAEAAGLKFMTPPHDVAAWVVKELEEHEG